jgi:hypothetical protein
MEERAITESESIRIIQEMIDKSKQQLRNRSKYLLLWGIAVFICALTQYVLVKLGVRHTGRIWLAMPLLLIVHVFIASREIKHERVVTHNSLAIRSLWIALGISFFVVAFMFSREAFMPSMLILLYGIGTFTTGRILQFKPLIYGGLSCFILSIVSNYIEREEQLLILALSVLVSYIIPAILLKKSDKNA